MYIPIINTWRLNERHYGALQGLDKKETVEKHGSEQVQIWRRSYDIPPPDIDESSEYFPGNDPMYADVPKSELPKAESLKLTAERFMPEWENVLVPEIRSGKKILIAAHGNSLRALGTLHVLSSSFVGYVVHVFESTVLTLLRCLSSFLYVLKPIIIQFDTAVKHLDNISPEEICELNIPTGIPLVYELDDDLKPIPHPDAIAPLSGRYLGNQEEVKARIGAVLAQTGGAKK